MPEKPRMISEVSSDPAPVLDRTPEAPPPPRSGDSMSAEDILANSMPASEVLRSSMPADEVRRASPPFENKGTLSPEEVLGSSMKPEDVLRSSMPAEELRAQSMSAEDVLEHSASAEDILRAPREVVREEPPPPVAELPIDTKPPTEQILAESSRSPVQPENEVVPERASTPEEKLAKLEGVLAESRANYVRAEEDYRKSKKELNKFRGLNLNKFAASPRNEEYDAAIRRRETAIAEYQSAKQGLASHIWVEKKVEIVTRLGKRWEDLSDDERTAADGELAEFKAREIFPRFIIGEASELEKLKVEIHPSQDGGIVKSWKNGLNWYLKQNKWARLAFSSAVITGAIALTPAGAVGLAAASAFGQRFARGAVGVTAGQAVGAGVEKLLKATMKTEQKTAAAMENLQQKFSVGDFDVAYADREYRRIAEAEKSAKRKQLIIKAGAMIASGVGVSALSGHLLGSHKTAVSAADHPEPAPAPPGSPSGHDVAGRAIDIKPKVGAEAVISPKPTAEIVPPSGGLKIPVVEQPSPSNSPVASAAEAASEKPADYVSKAPAGGLKPTEAWRPQEDAFAGKGMLLTPEQLHEKALDAAATVKPGEGAWQAVHRQLELRLDDPAKYPRKGYFGLMPEEPSDSVAAKHALDVKTLEILKKEHFIDNDGSTLVGIKNEGFRVRLDDNDHVFVEKAGMPAVLDKSGTYTFKNVHGASGAAIGETAPAPIIENIPVAEVAPESAAAVIEGSTTATEHAANISHGVPSISETFFVKVPENFTFRNLIYEQLQKHYGDRLVEFDQYGRDRITGLFERYLADHPETIRGTDLSTLKPGEKIDFTGLFGDQNIVNERFHEATKWMLERLDMGANELKLLSSFGFNAEYPPDVHALGIIRGMKIGDFLDRFHENHIQNGGLVSFTDPDNDSVTVLLGRRHIKLAELLRNANLSPADRDKMTIAEFLKDVH